MGLAKTLRNMYLLLASSIDNLVGHPACTVISECLPLVLLGRSPNATVVETPPEKVLDARADEKVPH